MAIDGKVQAAFLPHSLVKQGEGRKIEVDDKSHLPVDNAIAVLKASNRQDAAKKFEAFILSDRGQEKLAITPLVRIHLARGQCGETRCNFLVAEGKFDQPFCHAQANPVAGW